MDSLYAFERESTMDLKELLRMTYLPDGWCKFLDLIIHIFLPVIAVAKRINRGIIVSDIYTHMVIAMLVFLDALSSPFGNPLARF